MIERRVLGEIPAKPHTVFKPKGASANAYEFVFTRDGFSGGFSILYMKEAPTAITSGAIYKAKGFDRLRFAGEAVGPEEMPLMRRHVQSWQAPEGEHLLTARTALFKNQTCRLSVVRGNPTADYSFTNGDADELYFIYSGKGKLHTMFGVLEFKEHDYVLIPRGVPYVFADCSKAEMLVIEGMPSIDIPRDFRNPHGQLKLEAPYTHRDFRSPQNFLKSKELATFSRAVTFRNESFTEHHYSGSPSEVIGWDGSVYPIAFSIHDYLPKTGKIHLPPNLHTTFLSSKFVVCSFVPRMTDYLENAIPCPYPHANVACDEFLYYVSGNFTSRKGIDSRSISFHPAGIAHGPQPGSYFGSVGSKSTNELAVMVDTWEPLFLTKAALKAEDPKYALSWGS